MDMRNNERKRFIIWNLVVKIILKIIFNLLDYNTNTFKLSKSKIFKYKIHQKDIKH